MHEDNTSLAIEDFSIADNPVGFYLYEVSLSRKESIGIRVTEKLSENGVKISDKKKIYHEKNVNGVVWSRGIHDPNYQDKLTLEGYMQRYCQRFMCTETPTMWPMEERIRSQILSLSFIFDILKEHAPLDKYIG